MHRHPLTGCGDGRCVRACALRSLPLRSDTGGGNADLLRVRVEIMGSQKCRIVGRSQPVLIMIDPILFTRTHTSQGCANGAAPR
jgi:hypothetical protein